MASGWLEPVSSAAAKRSTVLRIAAIGDDIGDLGLAFGQRAGLVEGNRVDGAQSLQHRAALQQQAAPGTGRQRGGDGSRRRDHQRAGAADQQDRQALVDPFVPVAAQQAAAAAWPPARNRHDTRRVIARETVDEALGRRLGFLRLLDQPHDAGNGVVGGGRRHPHLAHAASPLIVPAKTFRDALAHRRALAGHRRLVDGAFAPSTDQPSAEIRSPGRTRMVAPTARLSAGTSRLAVFLEQCLFGTSAPAMDALPRLPAATPSSSSPTGTGRPRRPPLPGIDDHRADRRDRHQHLDRKRRAGQCRHDGAPGDRDEPDQHGDDEGIGRDRRHEMAYGIGNHQRGTRKDGQLALLAGPPGASRGALVMPVQAFDCLLGYGFRMIVSGMARMVVSAMIVIRMIIMVTMLGVIVAIMAVIAMVMSAAGLLGLGNRRSLAGNLRDRITKAGDFLGNGREVADLVMFHGHRSRSHRNRNVRDAWHAPDCRIDL
jgi:hypothetical protein